ELEGATRLRGPARNPPDPLTNEYRQPRLEQVDRQVERLALLIASLLDVSRASAGRLQLDYADVPLAELVRQVVARLDTDLRGARCDVRLDVDERIVGRWDRLRLDQVVTNLVSNALKYGAGQPIEIATRHEGERVRIVVRDRGIGIDSKDQVRIFDRFARAVPADHFGGLGLGLWIVRVFVEAMRGTIAVASA